MTTTAPALDLAELQRWIGREMTAHDVVTRELVRRFNATFDAGGPEPLDGDIAPRLIHFCLAQSAAPGSELGEDGHPARGDFLPPVPLPRRMWAAGALAFRGEIRVGETVTRRSRVADVQAKQGRAGELCFVIVDHVVEASGQVAIEERQTLVYRGSGGGGVPPKLDAAGAVGVPRRTIEPTASLLFRYSALTFNGHRIHYDRTYAVEVEDYAGLVVHGPLQATLLMRLASGLRDGVAPRRFEFRSVSPLFDTAPVQLFADTDSGGSLRLWTARPDGPEAMVAEAHWDE
jgi:3-methylfumaryl-CoA hydratase